MPAFCIAALLGTQYQYAALKEVPPSVAAFSSTMTLLPSHAEKHAVGKPAPPPPHTTMSTSASKAAACASLVLNVTVPKVAAAALAPAPFRNCRRDSTASFEASLARSEEHTSELQSRQYLVC